MIDRATIDNVITTANIVEVVGEFVQLRKKGTNYTACCPFHNEKTPSFMVSPAKGIYKCFGCGKAGNSINFVMEHEKMTFLDAVRWVAKKYGIPIEERELTDEEKARQNERESMMVLTEWAQKYFQRQLEIGDGLTIGKAYFTERGFSDETIKDAGLGYCPDGGNTMTNAALKAGYKSEFLLSTGLSIKSESTGELYDRFRGRVIFPVYSIGGRVIAFGGRTLRTDKKVAKYQNSPESEIYHKSSSLYGIYMAKQAITSNDSCILVEGYADVLQMHQRGIRNVVASSGTSLTVEQIQLIKRFTSNITVIYDGDSAGIKASLRGIDMILAAGMNVKSVLLPDGKDPDDFARENNLTYIEGYIQQHQEDFITFKMRILLAENPDDPQLRGDTIRSIVESISVIPDPIQRSVYIRNCAQKLETDPAILENSVREKRATMIDGTMGREYVQNQRKKQNFTQRRSVQSRGKTANSSVAVIQDAQMIELEKEIVGYLLQHGDTFIDIANPNNPDEIYTMTIFDFIVHEITMGEITFHNPTYAEIIDAAKKHLEDNTPMSSQELICSANPAIAEFVSEIIFREDPWSEEEIEDMDEYTESDKNTKRSRAFENEKKVNLSDAVPKAMILYKSTYLTSEIASLSGRLLEMESQNADQTDVNDIFRRISELTAARAELLEKYNRIL